MSTATSTARKTAAPKAPKLTADEKAALKAEDAARVASALETLKTAWKHTDGTLEAAAKAFKQAKEDLDIQRVYKCRIAVRIATLKSSARSKWEPNLNAAATFLNVDKATLRPYVEGGKSGVAAGFGEASGTPTAEEIKATMDGYRSATKEGRQAKKQELEGENGPGNTPVKEPKQDPVTQDAVIKAVEELQTILKRFTREQGFDATVGGNLQETLGELQQLIELHKVDGGA